MRSESQCNPRLYAVEDFLAMSRDELFLERLARQSATANPHDAIPAVHFLFAIHFAARDPSRLVAQFFTEDTLQPADWSAPACVVNGRTALRALFDGMTAIHRMRHVTLQLTPTDDYTAHELGLRHMELHDGSEAVARYAALWQYGKGLGWRVRQWLSAVDASPQDILRVRSFPIGRRRVRS